jgi:type IV pilus assembly protein PilE
MVIKTQTQKGFTLVEALVVVAIIGIISGVGWHFFTRESYKNKRTEAIAALTRIANAFEDCHSDTKTYVGCQNTAAVTAVTNNLQHYAASYNPAPTATTYTIKLTAIGDQVNDTDCTSMSIDSLGRKTFTGSAQSSVARCWGSSN